MRRTLTVAALMGGSVFFLTPLARAATVSIGPNHEFLVDGQPFLPVMQWLQSSSRIAYQKGLGINTFVGNGGGGTAAEFLAECEAQGVWCVMDSGDMSVSAHPSLLGWVFGDEPDLGSNAIEPAAILTQYQSIKAADSAHVTLLTVTSGFFSEMDPPTWMNGDRSRYFDYAAATDAVGFDLYPVYGWCRPDWLYRVGASQQELVTTYAPTAATYQWIECVRTSGQWCDIAAREPDDGPTPEEVRNEVWQAVAHGAKAIGYFTHSWECPPDTAYSQFCLSAAQEAELTRTNGQLTALTAAILAAPYEQTVTVTPTPSARVDWIARRVGSQVTVFAVNVDTTPIEVSFDVPGVVAGGSVEVYDEDRSLTRSGDAFTDSFDPLGVHIYQMTVDVGAAGTGGSGGGGSGATGGGPASGGGGSGATGGTGTAGEETGADEEGGCNCAVPSGRSTGGALLGLALLAGLLRRRSRHHLGKSRIPARQSARSRLAARGLPGDPT